MNKFGKKIFVTPDVVFGHYSSPTFRELISRGEWDAGQDEILGRNRFNDKWRDDPDFVRF